MRNFTLGIVALAAIALLCQPAFAHLYAPKAAAKAQRSGSLISKTAPAVQQPAAKTVSLAEATADTSMRKASTRTVKNETEKKTRSMY